MEGGEAHHTLLKWVEELKIHLNGMGLIKEDFKIESWSDADFAADKVDRKLVSGCVLTMDGAVVLCHARNSQVCR